MEIAWVFCALGQKQEAGARTSPHPVCYTKRKLALPFGNIVLKSFSGYRLNAEVNGKAHQITKANNFQAQTAEVIASILAGVIVREIQLECWHSFGTINFPLSLGIV